MEKIEQKLYNREINLKNSLLNYLPVILGFFLWSSIVLLGINYFGSMFINEQENALVLVVWLVVCLNLSKIIPQAINTYYIEEVR